MSDTNNEKPSKPPASRTARESKNLLGLGRTQGQSSAEIMAGIRADRAPNPEHLALAKYIGQTSARIADGLAKHNPNADYVVARPYLFRKVIEPVIAGSQQAHVIVELACGFSPGGLYMARQYPALQYIEVDLPDVVAEKQDRLKSGGIPIPPNLIWRQADLGVVPLSEILNGQRVDVVMAQGLMAYFEPAEMERIARYVADSLLPNGMFAFDVLSEEGVKSLMQMRTASNFFQRQAGAFLGIVKDAEHARQFFGQAGYASIDAYRPTDLAPQIAGEVSVEPAPEWDTVLIVVARKAAAEQAPTETTPVEPESVS